MADDQDDKTEEPTDKKIEDAKKEGNIGKSAEIVGAVTLTFGTIYLLFFSSFTFGGIEKMMKFVYSFILIPNEIPYYVVVHTVTTTMLYSLMPLFIIVMFFIMISNWTQFGLLFTPIKLKFEKLDPIKGMSNVFAFKKVIEGLKLTAKLMVLIIVMVLIFFMIGDQILSMMQMELNASLQKMFDLIIYFLASILLIIIIFAIIDYIFVMHHYMKSLRMSKQDIKDEFKNMEGDPQVKGRIRQIQMKMGRQRMMNDVPEADVVITNPTHYAVALKYDNTTNEAPIVVAKGIDFLAKQIRDKAREHNVPIVENPSLARSLYDQVEIDQELPSEFYQAIADILKYVYELNQKR